jgi:hypothetical protein
MKRARARGAAASSQQLPRRGRSRPSTRPLSCRAKGGKLRRLARGLYKVHPKLGPLSPATDHVARAVARESGSQVRIAGARSANALGLYAQIPAESIYLIGIQNGKAAQSCNLT